MYETPFFPILLNYHHGLMPQVFKLIAAHACGNVLQAAGTDIEQGGSSHDNNNNGQESSSTHHQQKGKKHQGIQLQKALQDSCMVVYLNITWITEDQDLTR